MPATETPLALFLIRYKHNHEVIDVYSHGETGKDAFERFLQRMVSWGKDPKEYKLVSARQVQSSS